MPRDLHASLLKPFVALATPGMYLFYKYSQYKRQQQEQNRRKVTERELAQLNHKIDKLLAKLEEHEPELASSQEEECVVCISAKASMQTFPCGHCVVCRKCFVKTIQMAVSQRLLPLRCVICRTKILRLKQMTGGGAGVLGATGGAVGGSNRTISLCHSVSQTSRLTSLSSSSYSSTVAASVNVPPVHRHHHHLHYHHFHHDHHHHEYDERGGATASASASATLSASASYHNSHHRYHSIPELEVSSPSVSATRVSASTGAYSRHSSKSPSRGHSHRFVGHHGFATVGSSFGSSKTSSLSSSTSMPLVLPASSSLRHQHHSRYHQQGGTPPTPSSSHGHRLPYDYAAAAPTTSNSMPRSASRSSSRHGAGSVSSLPSPSGDSGVINKVLASMSIRATSPAATPTTSKAPSGTKERSSKLPATPGGSSIGSAGSGGGGGSVVKSKKAAAPSSSSSSNNNKQSSGNQANKPTSSSKEYKVTGTPEILYFKPVGKEKSTSRKSPFRAIHGKLPSLPKVTIRSRSSSKTLLIKKDHSSKD